MFEKLYRIVKNTVHKIDMKINQKKYGYSDKLPKNIKYYEGSLYDAVYDASFKWPYNTAIEYYDTQINYKELIKRINKAASALKYIGIEEDDIVTICMPNTPEAVIMFYAINEIGAIANMIHPLSSEVDIKDYLVRTNSKAMLCIDMVYPKIKEIIKETSLEKVIVASATISMEKITSIVYQIFKGRKFKIREDERVIYWNRFINNGSNYKMNPHARRGQNDPAVILYSGGTTGKSKGVLLSNLNFNADALQAKYASDILYSNNAFLTFLPNFHAFGLGICTHIPLYFGMRVVLIPQFNVKKFKSYIRKYKFNILCGVPTIYEYITKLKFKPNELKCIKMAVSGGDNMSMDLKNRAEEVLRKYGSKANIQIGYGLTEASGVIAFSPLGIKESDIIGYAFPDCKFLIKDLNSNKEMSYNEDGEILFTGPNLMMGYYNDPVETENVFININGKKWLRTGDIGFIDSKGLLHFKSRLKRMIITSGYNVYPSHIEKVIMESGYVSNCAVVGVKHPTKGEVAKAFIVLKDGGEELFIKNKINKYLKDHLAKYEVPKEYRIIDELPVTKMGKINYKVLEKLD